MSNISKILNKKFSVLDKGFIRVVDCMGDDSSIVQAARVSYGEGTKHVSKDKGLINYLMKHKHTSPFEMCEIKLHIKLPIFVARQWIRHRTANVNEYSARYSVLSEDFYVPDINRICFQSETNKQGSGSSVPSVLGGHFISDIKKYSLDAYSLYKKYLDLGIAREIVRSMLPINFYTEFYWKIDLHNLLHFLRLRSHSHAQYEIREYSDIILYEIIKKWVPLSYDAFMEYQYHSVNLSKKSLDIIKSKIKGDYKQSDKDNISKRELEELELYLGEKL